jgi:hypothetical protein
MYSDSVRQMAKSYRSNGHSYKEIGDLLNISLFSARKLCIYERKRPLKRGRKFSIDKKTGLAIKRKISCMNDAKVRVNSLKLIEELNLNVSKSTVQRHLKRCAYKYKKAKNQIILSKQHKAARLRIITAWLSQNHEWELTIFSDEKRFSMDGPDDWQTYVPISDVVVRQKRQCRGGGIMVWLMCLPSGLLSFRVIEGKFNSQRYINLLQEMIVPIMKLNYGSNFFFQEDNCAIHKSRQVKEFMSKSKINVIEWPSKSPDINMVEDIWSMISNHVYDGEQFQYKADLIKKVTSCIHDINQYKRHLIKNLYASYRKRLIDVVVKKGNLYNK